MNIFTEIVSICSGLTVIAGLVSLLVKPIREKITHQRANMEMYQKNFNEIRGEIKLIKKDIDGVGAAMRQDKATRARTQILRFADEIYQGTLHTKEHFDEILEAIDYYNKYCERHPDFKNYRTVNAQKIINDIYNQCQKEHTFLGSKKNGDAI